MHIVTERLGAGGFGTAWRLRDETKPRPYVAVKVMKEPAAAAAAAYEAEARANDHMIVVLKSASVIGLTSLIPSQTQKELNASITDIRFPLAGEKYKVTSDENKTVEAYARELRQCLGNRQFWENDNKIFTRTRRYSCDMADVGMLCDIFPQFRYRGPLDENRTAVCHRLCTAFANLLEVQGAMMYAEADRRC